MRFVRSLCAAGLVLCAVLVVPSLAGAAGNGKLRGADSSTNGEALAYTVEMRNPGKLKTVIKTPGRSRRIVYSYSITCKKGRRQETKTKRWVDRTQVSRKIRKPIRNPNSCIAAVNAKIKDGTAAKIVVKIFEK